MSNTTGLRKPAIVAEKVAWAAVTFAVVFGILAASIYAATDPDTDAPRAVPAFVLSSVNLWIAAGVLAIYVVTKRDKWEKDLRDVEIRERLDRAFPFSGTSSTGGAGGGRSTFISRR